MPAKREALPPKPGRARDDARPRKPGRARAPAEAAPPPGAADTLGAALRADTIRYLGQEEPARQAPSEVRARSYQGRGEIGRGGMGVVHRVHDERLHREVAMKILASPLARDPARVQSFVEEARIAGGLEHPHIVPVHELGEDDRGQPYFTMKLVRGRSLLEWLADPAQCPGSPDRLQDGLEIFLKACDAIQFAHSRGVIHRDLKPANVMVGDFGEVYVMDWGVARPTRGERRAGARERAEGTPRYMAPEQARAAVEEQDERTDVFGLGAMLYEIVTGLPPYPRHLEGQALLDAVRRGDFRPPEEAVPAGMVSAPILRTVRKALARERADRHASVAELKAEVQRFLRGGLALPQRDFAPGTRIVTEGEPGEAAFIIVRGSCVAYRMADGERRVLRRMGPGDVFGEMAVLSRLPRTATVEAVDDVTALVLTRSVLDEGLGPDSWVGALVRALAARFRELDQRRP
jgi:eukaryotic-like serine/threonine-protein kinase